MVREGLAENYPQLQNLIKRDPAGYQEEFKQQYEHFLSVWNLLSLGHQPGPHMEAMVMFMAHCAPLYKALTVDFPKLLIGKMEDLDGFGQFEGSLKKCIVQAALLLKRDKLVDPAVLIPVLFRLLRLKDKSLRELITASITQDLKKANVQLSKVVLNFLESSLLSVTGLEDEGSASAAVQSLSILISVYGRNGNLTNDNARPVNIIANAGLNDKNVKLMLLGLNFLIGQAEHQLKDDDNDDNEDHSSSDEVDEEELKESNKAVRDAYSRMRIAGKTKGRQARLDRLLKKSKKVKSGKNRKNSSFPAIQLLYDPQAYCERLIGNLKRSTAPFEAKLTMMNVISLIIGQHQLVEPDFYPILLRYLQPHQRKVTKVLCYCAQASHAACPVDMMEMVVKAIANNFIADHCAGPVIAAGLNAVRECCQRCPDAMTDTLLQDLAQYKGYKDKSVMMAARSLIGLYREVAPEKLHRKDRGRPDKKQNNAAAAFVDSSEDVEDGEQSNEEEGEETTDSEMEDAESMDEYSDDSETESQIESDAESNPETPEDLILKAQTSILSEDDLAKLKANRNRPAMSTIIDPDSLMPLEKKRMNKQQRLEHVKAGRNKDGKFGATGKTAEHRSSGKSQSNKVKRKGKLAQMLKRSKAGMYGGKKPKMVKKRRHA